VVFLVDHHDVFDLGQTLRSGLVGLTINPALK
jgi:hypothetical protein